ncbi:MAG TPA: hypothetical protein VFD73_18335, partial [Gemmatimonadales bacterium]|nr:hypothetical protein [Gemmatimonadales bacterium]
MTKTMSTLLPWFALLLVVPVPVQLSAQTLTVPASALADSTARPAAIARLASQAASVYRDSNSLMQMDQEFRLQLLAGHPDPARATLAQLRKVQSARRDTAPANRALDAQYEIYLRAKQLQSDSTLSFADA